MLAMLQVHAGQHGLRGEAEPRICPLVAARQRGDGPGQVVDGLRVDFTTVERTSIVLFYRAYRNQKLMGTPRSDPTVAASACLP
jgi:hypothetical protein